MNPRTRAINARVERDLFTQSILETRRLSIGIESFNRRRRVVLLRRPQGIRFAIEADELRAVIVALEMAAERLGGG